MDQHQLNFYSQSHFNTPVAAGSSSSERTKDGKAVD